jgi:tetratricopeptide (TPR) repeat protein
LTGPGLVHRSGLTLAPFLRILHHGYRRTTVRQKDKLQRNLDLLRAALQDAPGDPYLNYQLGNTLFQAEDYAGAWRHFEAALAGAPDSALLLRDAGYCLKALGRSDEALALVDRGLSLHPAYTDLLFLRGLLLLDAGKASEAAQTFLECLEAGEAPAHYSSRIGVGSFLPAHNLGVIFEVLGDLERAAEGYRLALSFNPDYEPARTRLAGVVDCRKPRE